MEDAQTIQKAIEDAIYTYLQALRLLGRTTVNTEEIAAAFDLPIDIVNEIAPTLKYVKLVE